MLELAGFKFNKKNILLRFITSIILVPLTLYIVYQGDILYLVFIFIISSLIFFEWSCIIYKAKFNIIKKLEWYSLGLIYSLILAWSMITIRYIPNTGYLLTLWLLIIVWVTDIFAYFIGTAIGGPKLAPRISPNKTWSGFLGGITASFMAGIVFAYIQHDLNFALVSPILSVVAQLGDLLESAFKRYFGVKNSGVVLLGHGGFMDRLDSLVTASLFIAFCVA